MDTDTAIRVAWDYLGACPPPEKSDILFLLGNEDLRCGDCAARLWREGYAPLLVTSGATGRSTAGVFTKSEAELFADRAAAGGVPRDAIVMESRASNTGENVRLTRALLADRGVNARRVLIVQKPYAARRVLATLALHWPEPAFSFAAHTRDFDEYCADGRSRDEVVAMLAGELHRVAVYPSRGWQAPVHMPPEARRALHRLADAGYTRHLLRDAPLP